MDAPAAEAGQSLAIRFIASPQQRTANKGMRPNSASAANQPFSIP
jgi:hypothetical protein